MLLVEEMKNHNLCYNYLIISFGLEVFFDAWNNRVRFFPLWKEDKKEKWLQKNCSICHLWRNSVSWNNKSRWPLVLPQKKKHLHVLFQEGLALMQL